MKIYKSFAMFAAMIAITWGAISHNSPTEQQRENAYRNQSDKGKKTSISVGKSDKEGQCTAAECKEKQKSFWEFSLTDTVIAIFTIVLAGVGYCQWQQIKRTVDSAEKIEAPFLIAELLNLQMERLEDQRNRPVITYTFRNHGRTPAVI